MKHRAKKEFGQNFLTNQNIVKKIIEKAKLSETDIVLEIGPGKGFMTDFLLANAKTVLAIELDKDLFDFLTNKYKDTENLDLIQGDCLKKDWTNKPNKLIANIPYNITSSIIFKMLDYYEQFDSIILMMQEEVGDRIVAPHDSKTYGILSVILQKFYNIEKFAKLPPSMFNPKPKVSSALLEFKPKTKKLDKQQLQNYINFVKFCFNQRRKILLSRMPILNAFYEKNNLNKKVRPENISVEMFWQMFEESFSNEK